MREYLKIWFQDIEIASEFFEGNEKHLGEFLVNVYREYAGIPTSFKCKQVAKYFQTYRKQIEFIKKSKEFGNKGWEKQSNNQEDTTDTLRGSPKGVSEEPLKQKLKVKSKKINNTLFEKFWELYDKKEGRVKCEKKFNSLPDEIQNKIIAVVPNYVQRTPEVKYRKNPLTWLNGEHWDDESSTQPTRPKIYV